MINNIKHFKECYIKNFEKLEDDFIRNPKELPKIIRKQRRVSKICGKAEKRDARMKESKKVDEISEYFLVNWTTARLHLKHQKEWRKQYRKSCES